jgi:putative component of membrane protein insertase Oxa1/YidC/SpoIIIJ protein YidD
LYNVSDDIKHSVLVICSVFAPDASAVHKWFRYLLILLYMCVILAAVNARALPIETNNMKAPVIRAGETEKTSPDDYLSNTFLFIVTAYQRSLNPVVSRGCPSYPSCSQYMRNAVQTLGVPMGIIVGLGRMLHESGEIHYGTVIQTDSGYRLYDTLQNNTFWWKSNAVE